MIAVGVVGAGRMGGSIARHVSAAGYDVYVRDPAAETRDRFPFVHVASPNEPFPSSVGVVIVTVPYGDALENLVVGANDGLFHPDSRGDRVVVISSTVPPDRMPTIDEELRKQGIDLIECPLCRGSDGIAAGEALALVAGSPHALEFIRPILTTYASDIEYLGAVFGTAQILKSINNLMLWAAVAGNIAGLHIARELDIDEAHVRRIISESTGDSWALRHWDRHKHWPWAVKDLSILLESIELDSDDEHLVRALRRHLSAADELTHASG